MQAPSKVYPGATEDSQIIFMVYDPTQEMDSHQTGCVESFWRTGEKASYFDVAGEQHFLHGLAMRYIGCSGVMQAMRLYVEARPDLLESALADLHKLPDTGCDLSMMQPMFECSVDAPPGRHGAGMQRLKLARLIVRV